jgi:hypothetical protein
MQGMASPCEAYVWRVFGFVPMDLVISGVAITGAMLVMPKGRLDANAVLQVRRAAALVI